LTGEVKKGREKEKLQKNSGFNCLRPGKRFAHGVAKKKSLQKRKELEKKRMKDCTHPFKPHGNRRKGGENKTTSSKT